MEELRKQVEYFLRYIQMLTSINNKALMKIGYPYVNPDIDGDGEYWEELLRWARLFIEVTNRPDSASYTDHVELLRCFWGMHFFIPNFFRFDHYLLLKYINSEFEAEANLQLPSWIKYIDPRLEEASKVSVRLEGSSIILNIKHGNIVTPVFLLVHGAIVLGPFVLASHILSDSTWERILQHLNDIHASLKN
jgi:hypothetical protein